VTAVDFSFELDEDSFSPGTYEITLTNGGNATHDLVVERDGANVAQSEQIGPGETSTFEVTLEEGDYVFYCSVGNHRAMGMEVPVTVTA
jgi:plastocyanin